MRILFTRFPLESAKGGAENQTMWLANGLKARGHAVSFLGSCPVLNEFFQKGGFKNSFLDIGHPPVTKWSAISFAWKKRAMKSACIRAVQALPEKPDVIVMLSLSEKILLTPWAHQNGIRVYWVEHDRIGSWLTMNPWLPALRKASEDATIICVSELSRRMMAELSFNSSHLVVIPNGVPTPVSMPERKLGAFTIGCLSRLSPEKGVDILLQALTEIPAATLSIVGSGREEGYLRTLIADDTKKIGMQRITLVPRVPDLETWYAGLDVFVLPSSDHDPFGLSAAEAMMRGIATVVTDACGIVGSVHDGCDVLVAKAGSATSLAGCIRRLLEPAFRAKIAKKGVEAARKHFSLDVMIERYEQCFTKNTHHKG